jgi:hypothetical protein
MTEAKLKKLDNMTNQPNPPTQRAMAKKLNTCQYTVMHHIHTTLNKKKKKKPKVHSLNAQQIEVRKNKSLPLYKKLKSNWEKIVTTDEAWFFMSDGHGKRDIQYVSKNEKAPELECFTRRENHSKGFMVWAGISKRGKTKLYFVDPGAKVNSDYYISHILKPFLRYDVKKLYPDGDYIFHQDSAPAHVSKMTCAWMEPRMPFLKKEEVMPKSPDAAPMDYFVWGWMKRKLNKIEVHDMTGLKKALKKVWRQLPQEMIDNALKSWPERVHDIYKAKGHHIEKY